MASLNESAQIFQIYTFYMVWRSRKGNLMIWIGDMQKQSSISGNACRLPCIRVLELAREDWEGEEGPTETRLPDRTRIYVREAIMNWRDKHYNDTIPRVDVLTNVFIFTSILVEDSFPIPNPFFSLFLAIPIDKRRSTGKKRSSRLIYKNSIVC